MDKKTKGSIAEQKVILALIERNITVSIPIGNNDAYDLVADINGSLKRIQIKSAYINTVGLLENAGCRRSLTNSRIVKYKWYSEKDIDLAIIVYLNDFYIIPAKIFCSYRAMFKINTKIASRAKHDISIYKNNWSIFENNSI